MRICFLTNTLDKNCGWGRYSSELIFAVEKESEAEVIILTDQKTGHPGETPVLARSMGNFLRIFILALKVRKYFKGCDVIHALDGYPYGVIAFLGSLGLRKKLIISGIGTYSVFPLDWFWRGMFLKLTYRSAKKILCISQFTLEEIKKRLPGLTNLEKVLMGVDFPKFELREEKEFGDGRKIILSVGAIKERKGYHISLPAVVDLVKREKMDLEYRIVGDQKDEKYFDYLREIVEKEKMTERVKFLKNLSDQELVQQYHQADLFLLVPVNVKSGFEGFGLVYVEAGASKLPVIGAENCGAEDAIQNGINGFLVKQNNVIETIQAVKKILQDKKLSEKMGLAGFLFAKNLSWTETAKKTIKAYN